jgi:hypothetical protein
LASMAAFCCFAQFFSRYVARSMSQGSDLPGTARLAFMLCLLQYRDRPHSWPCWQHHATLPLDVDGAFRFRDLRFQLVLLPFYPLLARDINPVA